MTDTQLEKYKHQILVEGDNSMPLEFYPTAMYHSHPVDSWDHWENNKYREQMTVASAAWSRIRSIILKENKKSQARSTASKSI